ncbi:MAG: branched-chain amino acid ABC transporter permease [Ardenticatenaceae bacterium]|nr:branched-chain amino acid ABC transporter permease [Ardenticatenaceae bacterium]HBY98960.1 branched-chain amino acid ABC transporter permease [Chloroflexota bacterium]
MESLHPAVLAWLLLAGPLWSAIGTWGIPRVYREKGLDTSQAGTAGALAGFVAGPFLLAPLWRLAPELSRGWNLVAAVLAAGELYVLFALLFPKNLCVTNASYVLNQISSGLTIGFIYALMAVGLTLIYSVQGIVSFAHGQFYMIGGYVSYFLLQRVTDLNPIIGVPVAGAITLLIGMAFERGFLRPMHLGRVERAAEYAILITFGFGFFLEYTALALVGPFSQKTAPYLNARSFVLGPLRLLPNRLVAAAVGIALIGALLYLIRSTWTGKGLRAVSMDKQAAAVIGVDPLRMNTLAFGIGTMLAGMSGAALIPIFTWVPWVGTTAAVRSFVIIVLGGLGSIPGALIGGIIIGLVQALGAGCYPDPSKGAAYKEAFGLIIFVLVLLWRPTGLFGRE